MSTSAAPADRPRVLGNLQSLAAGIPAAQAGAAWRLQEAGRQLDANLVHLPPGEGIGTHAEPDLDVLFLVVAGDGTLSAGGEDQPLTPGVLVWLPDGSARSLTAGGSGLSYLTVHRRRPGMRIRRRQAP